MEKIFVAQGMSRRSFMRVAFAAAGSLGLVACAPSTGDGTATDGGEASVAGTADLVVVGAGAAGLMAAAKAAAKGASVIVLESQRAIGGTTALSGGNYTAITPEILANMPERTEKTDNALKAYLDYNAADFGDYADALTTLQAQIPAYLESDSTVMYNSIERWLVDHFLGTQGTDKKGNVATTNYEAVAASYYNQGEIYEWLVSLGVEFANPRDNDPTGGPVSMSPSGGGATYTNVLAKEAEAKGAEIFTGVTVDGLVVEEGKVVGVTAGNAVYMANKGVMLATGGFGSNGAMVANNDLRYDGITADIISMEADGAQGQGIDMATAIGAATTGMGFVQYFPNLMPSPVALTEVFGVVGAGKFIVNKEAQRFTSDGFGFLRNSADSLNQTGALYFLVGDAAGIEKLGDKYENLKARETVFEGNTIEEVAAAAGLDASALAATVAKFNEYCDAGEDPDFGRKLSAENKVETAPFIITCLAQAAQNTMGGLVIDAQGRVLNESGAVIDGLYAAGEVTGIFDGAARRHGDNYAHIFYYGQLIGETVAAL